MQPEPLCMLCMKLGALRKLSDLRGKLFTMMLVEEEEKQLFNKFKNFSNLRIGQGRQDSGAKDNLWPAALQSITFL